MTERYEITIEANDTTEASEKFARVVERDFASLGFPLALIADGNNTYRTAKISHIETIPAEAWDAPDAGNAALMALARQQHGDEVVAVA
jgi:hypothetical protein